MMQAQSRDVWVTGPDNGPLWLGYVAQNYVEGLGYLWQAYRSIHGPESFATNTVLSEGEPEDTDEEAERNLLWFFGFL